jgi:hypothetical protein
LTDENRNNALILLWASMSSLQLTTDPTMSLDIMQDAIELYGNKMVQLLTTELLVANRTSASDIKKVKTHLIFGLFNKMDVWLQEKN